MPTMTIKKLPEDLYGRLKRSAALHRRSINAEAIVCLQRGLGVAALEPEDLLVGLRAVRDRARELYVTDEEMDAVKREGRP